MTDTRFTPGPWHIASIGSDIYIATEERTVVAAIHPDPSVSAPHEANANLIAAAPAMFEALESARKAAAGSASPYWPRVLATIDAALNQARGL